jgi:hypothetical protein
MPAIVKMTLPDGRVVDGVEVQVDSSNERWSEIELADGTKLRLKLAVLNAIRAKDAFDLQGNPIYTINMTPVMAIVEVPASLKKKGN